jgi:hypothetical protein
MPRVTEKLDLYDLLGYYFDLLTRGWANTDISRWSQEREDWLTSWAEALNSRARTDRLSIRCLIGWEPGLDGMYGGSVFLNWPNGERSSAHNQTGLPARLEREWAQTLMRARERVEAELDTADRDWRSKHRPHL